MDSIKIFHTNLNESQQKEEDFFASDKSMCSVKELYKSVMWKTRSLWLLREIIEKYKLDFSGRVLELAGGYGVQAAYLKTLFGDKINLTYSDVSLTAVKSSERYEKYFETKIDEKWVIEAENIPAPDNTFDQVFFFAGFHHIQDPVKCLSECHRVLKSGGKLYLLLEPSCPKIFQKPFNRHTARELIEEKSYTKREYRKLLQKDFSLLELHNFTGYFNRESRRSLIYYFSLSILPNFLVNLLPCSQVIVVEKNRTKNMNTKKPSKL